MKSDLLWIYITRLSRLHLRDELCDLDEKFLPCCYLWVGRFALRVEQLNPYPPSHWRPLSLIITRVSLVLTGYTILWEDPLADLRGHRSAIMPRQCCNTTCRFCGEERPRRRATARGQRGHRARVQNTCTNTCNISQAVGSSTAFFSGIRLPCWIVLMLFKYGE